MKKVVFPTIGHVPARFRCCDYSIKNSYVRILNALRLCREIFMKIL